MKVKELAPFIRQYDGVLTNEQCETIIRRHKSKARPPGKTSSGVHPEFKHSLDWLVKDQSKTDRLLFRAFHEIETEYVGVYPEVMPFANVDTGYSVQRYLRGEGYYKPHIDSGPADPGTVDRVLSGLMYLNEIEEGGRTIFTHWDVAVKPRPGRAILFPPYWTHEHQGEIPLSDEKFIIHTFFCFQPQTDVAALEPEINIQDLIHEAKSGEAA